MYPQITGAYTLLEILDLLHTWEFKTLSMLFVFYLAFEYNCLCGAV